MQCSESQRGNSTVTKGRRVRSGARGEYWGVREHSQRELPAQHTNFSNWTQVSGNWRSQSNHWAPLPFGSASLGTRAQTVLPTLGFAPETPYLPKSTWLSYILSPEGNLISSWRTEGTTPKQKSPQNYRALVLLPTCVRLSATPWTAARRASLSFTTSQSLPKLMSIEPEMPSNQNYHFSYLFSQGPIYLSKEPFAFLNFPFSLSLCPVSTQSFVFPEVSSHPLLKWV